MASDRPPEAPEPADRSIGGEAIKALSAIPPEHREIVTRLLARLARSPESFGPIERLLDATLPKQTDVFDAGVASLDLARTLCGGRTKRDV